MEDNKQPEENQQQNSVEEQSKPSSINEQMERKKEAVDILPYDHGFLNGVLKIEGKDFESFIDAMKDKTLTKNRLDILEKEIDAEKENHTINLEERKELKGQIISSKNELKSVEFQEELTKKKQEEYNFKIKQTERARNEINPYYNYFVVLLMILAGFVFIGADLLVSQSIFYHALDVPHIEAWVMATAFAALAFILKPGVDRIFEEPYLKGENRKRALYFLAVVGILAMVCLGFLGYYRNSAFLVKDKIGVISNSNNGEVGNSENTGLTESISNAIIGLKEAQLSNSSIIIVFTLGSILFALAGAICLSIGFSGLNLLRRKYGCSRLIKRLKRHTAKAESEQKKLKEQIASLITRFQKAEFELTLLPDPKSILDKIEQLKNEHRKELENLYNYRKQIEKSWYKEGYSRGGKYKLNEDALIFVPTEIDEKLKPKYYNRRYYKSSRRTKRSEPTPRNGRYLHEQLRDMIHYNFNKSQGNGH